MARSFGFFSMFCMLLMLRLLKRGIAQTTLPAPTTPTPALTTLDCNFEGSTETLCGFTQDTSDIFDWTWHAGSTSTEGTGPLVDHTYGTAQGHYVYTESSFPQNPGDIARLVSPIMAATSNQKCFKFFYQLNGEDLGVFRILLRPFNASHQQLQEWRGHQGTTWLKAGITIPPQPDVFQIIFEGQVGESYRGDIAVDDVEYIDNVCPLDNFQCSFEDRSLCGFQQDRSDDFDFTRMNGRTRSGNTGPRLDHTFKNESGYYVYIEATHRQQGHVARLISPMLAGHTEGQPSCLIFFYHMYGYMMGDLNVYVKNSTSPSRGNPVWSLWGNRGDKWRAAEVEITTPLNYQLVFEAERGESYRGDIALDDVNVTFAACPGHYVIRNVSSVTCDFEEAEICHYTQDQNDDFDWIWANRGTWWRFTGPSADHTRGDELGFYLYIDAQWSTPRTAKARLTSPEVPAQRRPSCLEFWYHMYGQDVETLKVYVKPAGDDLPDTPQWIQTGNHGDVWHRATIDITIQNIPFKIVFEGQRGVYRRDDIAFDDVKMYENSPCPSYPTPAFVPTTLPPAWSDISCTFEADYCNYTQAIDDIFDWTRHQGVARWKWWMDTIAKDHTLGSDKGHYMLLNMMGWWFHWPNDNARFVSPLVQASSKSRCLKFFFILYGYYADFLNVYIVRHGQTLPFDPAMSMYGDHGIEWQSACLDLPPTSYPFYVVFEGIISRVWWYPETAIDDISLQDGSCPKATTQTLPLSADCDFESDSGSDVMCGYTQESVEPLSRWHLADKFLWQINAGPTSTNDTGPSVDHTFMNNTGHYLYMEASQPQRPGNKARLTSPNLASKGQIICLQFYYQIYGEETGSLTVQWSAPNFPEKEIMRPKKTGNRWFPAYIELNDVIDNYQIIFEGTVGNGYKGDIAIDDIRFLLQPCSGFKPESSCTFDTGYEDCSYRQDDTDQLKWSWFDIMGTEPPPLANVSATGSYLYITGDARFPVTAAVLRLPFIPRQDIEHCMSFDVIVQNDPDANLQVAVEYSTGQWRNLMSANTTVASKWTRFNLTLPLDLITEDPFQIKLSAIFGSKQMNGVIAIDNVTVTQASCDAVNASVTHASTGASSGAHAALGTILALVLVCVVLMVAFAWYFIRRSGSGDSPFAIKYKNQDDNVNPVTLSGEPGIANPVYEKATLENNS